MFNTRPYLHHHSPEEKADENAIREAFRVKATTASLADGKRTDVLLAPVRTTCSSKEYLSAEYHVSVDFDLQEFERTATEKLLHAQLVVLTSILVDEDNRAFVTEESLAKRGLPIYVYE